MLNVVFSGFLIGLPMCFGTYMILHPARSKDRETGFFLVLYAIAVTSAFVYFVPTGKLLDGNFSLKMPVIIVVGALVGGITGFLKRR